MPQVLFIHSDWPYKRIFLDETGPTRDDNDHYVANKTQVIALSNFIFERVRQDPASEESRLEQLAYLEGQADLIKTFDPYLQGYHNDWFYLDQLYGPAAETLQRVRPGPLIKLYHLPYANQPYSLKVPDIPVPVNANFWGKLILLGYDLPVRRAEPGGTFPITLYWQAATRMHETYVVFNHLLDGQQHNWGGYDRWPRESANTILWRPGEVVIDTFSLPVAADAPDGIYSIDVGLYNQADHAATPLPILHNGQPIDQNSIRIGPVKVGGSPPDAVLSAQEINPQTQLAIELGDPPVILMRGYDASLVNDGLKLTLYWESLAQTTTNWTTFVQLRDATGEIVFQKDGPTGNGRYPTSLWDAGEVIADDVVVPITGLSGSDYGLFIGLYNLETGVRLPVKGYPGNEISLGGNIEF